MCRSTCGICGSVGAALVATAQPTAAESGTDQTPAPAERTYNISRLEPTGESKICLRRDRIKAVAGLPSDGLLFDTDDGIYFNYTLKDCNTAHANYVEFYQFGAPSQLCRNDHIHVLGWGDKRWPVDCTLGRFLKMREKTSASAESSNPP